MHRFTVAFVCVAALAAGTPRALEQQARFTSRADVVSVDVSVRRRAAPVANLTASDFQLLDNGVAQVIDAVSIEAVPIDVTLFHDTSPSLAGKLNDLTRDLTRIVKLLRPGDRFRLLTFSLDIDATPWFEAGQALDTATIAVGRISAVNDALMMALLWKPEPDRRHLVVALTDAVDAGSAVSAAAVEAVASRADSVFHLVKMPPKAGARYTAGQWLPHRATPDGMLVLGRAAARTGGFLHEADGGRDVVNAFKLAFDDFRQSYVLRYQPAGVTRTGWHDIQVTVPSVIGATVRARRGYFVQASR